jgi:hypothetical protein
VEAAFSGDSLKVENCIFHGLSGGAISIKGGSRPRSGLTIVNNTFYQCESAVAIEGEAGRVCHADSSGSMVFANNIVMKASSAFVFSGPFWGRYGRTTMVTSNCDFFDLSKGIVMPPVLLKRFVFIDTLMRNPLFASTDAEEYYRPDFMKPALPEVAGGGLSAAFTPGVDFFNKIRDVPITIGAVEGAQPPEGSLAKKAVAGNLPMVPLEFGMFQSYPNPFRQRAHIRFQIAGTGSVKTFIEILRIDGRVVRTLVNDEREPGYYLVAWDGIGNGGESVPVGTYLYRIRAGSFHNVKRMVLLR